MSWFKRSKENIASETQKREIPDGLWTKCESCGEIIHKMELQKSIWTCAKCGAHFRIGSAEYFELMLDPDSFREHDRRMRSSDPLKFVDTKRYKDRTADAYKKTRLYDAVRWGTGTMEKLAVVVAAMDFGFIGGSMGSVVGEKIGRAIDRAWKSRTPLIVVSSSGGARMMEGALSLMQMAKTSAKLARLSDARVPYISITDRSNDRWSHCELRHAGGREHRRARRADRLCRPTGDKADHRQGLAAGFSTCRVSSRTRIP